MEYKIVEKDAFRIVGVRESITTNVEENFKNLPDFWDRSFKSGIVTKILGLANGEPAGLLGATSEADDGNELYYYIAVSTDKPALEGMYECVIPAATWAVFTGSGNPADVHDLQKRIFSEWLPTAAYEWTKGPDIEVYLNDDPANMNFEVWLPVVKKA